ncbi:MAG TPA: hypothetical protein VGK34_06530 [Armatimonadota bacterium]|jgi:hypothetical protein
MRAFQRLVFTVLIAAAAVTSAGAGVTITKSSIPDCYDLSWSGEFTEILRQIHAECNQHSFAQVLKNATPPSENERKGSFISLMCVDLGHYYGRQFVWIGDIPVFTPTEMPSPKGACEAFSGQLVASLTPSQRATHKSQGCIPFSELTNQQQEIVAFLARNNTDIAPCPEPEFTKRLWESGLVVALEPSMWVYFQSVNETGKLIQEDFGTYCNEEVTTKFWEKHSPGQLSAGKLFSEAVTNPGPDAPGDSNMHPLDGVYTLRQLLQMVEKEGIRTEVDADTIKIEAHCDMTGAALARACAVSTAMDWHKEADGWYLAYDSIYKNLNDFGTSQQQGDYFTRQYDEALPAIRQMAYDGDMIFVADAPWHENFDLKCILDQRAMTWSELTTSQQAYLRKGTERYLIAYPPKTALYANLMSDLPAHTFKWQPHMKLYVLTKDGILYHEWLPFQSRTGVSIDVPSR